MKRQKPNRPEGHPTTTNASSPDCSCVSSEAIACRAHERYLQRGATHGQDLEHWLAAERELLDELAHKH